MDELPVTSKRVIKIWWCLLWRSIVIGALSVILINGMVELLEQTLIYSAELSVSHNILMTIRHERAIKMATYIKAGMFVMPALMGLWVTKRILKKKVFSDFRVVFIPTESRR